MDVAIRLKDWLGGENVRYFQLLKALTGTYSPVLKLNFEKKGIPAHPVHFREGMQVRNWMRDQPEFKDFTTEQFDNGWTYYVRQACQQYGFEGWKTIKQDDYNTYPMEGFSVIAADDEGNEEKLYFLMSSEYVWMKVDEENDDADEFTGFTPTKWKNI